ATQFRKRNVLQLSNAFAGHAEFLSDFLESLWLSAVETEALESDFLFAVDEDVEETADFVTHIFVAQQLERRLGVLVPDDFAELSRTLVADWPIDESWTNRDLIHVRTVSGSISCLLLQLLHRRS